MMQPDSRSSVPASTNSRRKLKRRRARAACITCHKRKVRCDGSIVGAPCANCRLDSLDCCMRVRRREKNPVKEPHVSSNHANNVFPLAPHSMNVETEIRDVARIPCRSASNSKLFEEFNDQALSSKLPHHRNIQYSCTSTEPTLDSVDVEVLQPFEIDQLPNDNVFSSHHRFLDLSASRNARIDGIDYLRSEGCFHLPKRPHLDELIRHYFYSVHPHLPVLDEEEFGSLCTRIMRDNDTQSAYSVLVLQAMLFAASAFASLSTLKTIGFQTYHVARKTFYKRAKLLYDFQVETDPIAISQAALLLSFHLTPTTPQSNTSWLSVAIQHARAENCHLYYRAPDLSARQKAQKKRLWWCCIIRDRVIALGMRRHIQITLDHFDFDQDTVKENDFAREIEHSEVYSAETKRLLVREFVVQCQLAVAVTSSLLVIYPLNGRVFPTVSTKSDVLKRLSQVEECTKKLAKWEDEAKLHSTSDGDNREVSCGTVIVYQDLTYLYFFSARIALCNYTIRMLNEHYDFAIDSMEQLNLTRVELEKSIVSVCRKVSSLTVSGFVGHLPITVVALVALPLALLYLNSKLSPNTSQQITSEHGFYSYAGFLRLLGLRFDFVDTVTNIICNAVQSASSALLRTDQPLVSGSSGMDPRLLKPSASSPRDWCDILAYQPRLYLRVLSLLDSSLSRGQHPSITENSRFTLFVPSSPFSLEDKASETWPSRSVVATNSLTVTPRLEPAPQEKATSWLEKLLRESNSEPLQQVCLPSAQVQKKAVNDAHAYLLHDMFGTYDDTFELLMEEGNLECEEKIMEEQDADQILDDMTSFMFNPSPAGGHL